MERSSKDQHVLIPTTTAWGTYPAKALESTFRSILRSLPMSEGVLMGGIALNKRGVVGAARNVDPNASRIHSGRDDRSESELRSQDGCLSKKYS